jgi:hypothetical protein
LHVVVHERDLVITHHELHDIGLDPPLRTTHCGSPTAILANVLSYILAGC